MTRKNTLTRYSLLPLSVLLGVILMSGAFFQGNYVRQYVAGSTIQNKKNGGQSKEQYFFNARKNPATGTMDYSSMLNCNEQVEKANRSHRAQSAFGLYWKTLGPTNMGGETRALLIDKNDKTGQTLIAGGICGGLWKSVNGGNTWDTIATNLSNACVSCITQDSAGNIYIGTGEGFTPYYPGEGFSCGMLGGGIFKSTDDGATFNIISATVPFAPNSTSVNWAYTNRIAVLPNSKVIYAATNGGLMFSTNGGNTFRYAIKGTSTKLAGNVLDVKASADGKLVVACVNGNGYYAYPFVSDSTFNLIHQTGYDSLASSNGGRIEFGIAPGNSNYVYASVVNSAVLVGVYFTMTAVSSGNGGNWYCILPGGSKIIDPYGYDGTYSSSIGVSTNNPGLAFFGGITMSSWTQTSLTDTAGSWTSITTFYGTLGDPTYVHPNIHAIDFDFKNPNTIYVGCDGGVYKSTNLGSMWQASNRNYYSTEFYSIAISPNGNNDEGVMGGTQDNGTPYISGTGYFPNDGVELSGGDGGQCAISSLNPNMYYVTTDRNVLLCSDSLSSYGTPYNVYTRTSGLNRGANIDSIANMGTGCFVTPLVMYENAYDTNTLDSMLYVANQSYNMGDTIYPVSANGNIPFPYIINKSLASGDTVKVQNRVVSKIATAFSATQGVWMMMQAADDHISPIWMPIGGPLSTPDAFAGNDPVHCMAFSPDGNSLFVGTEAGQLFRFSNLNAIIDTSYITGGIFSMPFGSNTPVANPLSKVVSTEITNIFSKAGLDILSISIDPKDGNKMIVTTGGYEGGTHVWYSNNALAASGVAFGSLQTNLPEMPVYCSVLDVVNSPYANGAILGTEHGVYTCPDVTVPTPVWSPDNTGMTNTIVIAMKQQTAAPWNCNNSGKIYMASNGRGLYVDSSFYVPTGIAQVSNPSLLNGNLSVYPNPMNAGGTISFTLPVSSKATITIYDIEGKEVKEIALPNQAPGLHNVSINSSDMPMGVYIATVTGTGFRKTAKFVVAR